MRQSPTTTAWARPGKSRERERPRNPPERRRPAVRNRPWGRGSVYIASVKLLAISDLHVGHPANRAAVAQIAPHPDDWLILAGDVCETKDQLAWVFDTLGPRFAQLVWVPGNHELWTMPGERQRGEGKYQELVGLCRARGIITPEDPYPVWRGAGGPHLVVPLFLLYDYSFAPHGMGPAEALAWARAAGIECTDEHLLDPDPHPSRQAWCHHRIELSEGRIAAARAQHQLPTVLINHFPLRYAHAFLPRIPRFSIWCGTRRTEDWPERYDATVVVYGHLHMPHTHYASRTRFEEVSLGYPAQWTAPPNSPPALRMILSDEKPPRL
jgi:hypothetical protein